MQTYLQRQPWCSAPIESTGSGAGSRAPHERPMGWEHAVVGTSGTASRKYEGHGGLCD
jgi:hypothetical protein